MKSFWSVFWSAPLAIPGVFTGDIRETQYLLLSFIIWGYLLGGVFIFVAILLRRRGSTIGFWLLMLLALIPATFGTYIILLITGLWWRFWFWVGDLIVTQQ